MNIKTAIAAGVFSVLSIGVSGVPEAMAATRSNHSGHICTKADHDLFDERDISHYFLGACNPHYDWSILVACPLVRRTTSNQGAIAYVDVRHVGNLETRCTLYSYNKTGGLLGSKSGSVRGNGNKRLTLNLKGANKSDLSSVYSVYCFIPESDDGIFCNGFVIGIDLEEY